MSEETISDQTSAPSHTDPYETMSAYRVAAYARDVVRQIISNGRPEPDSFISLCAAIDELESKVPTHEEDVELYDFHGRIEDIDYGMRHGFRCRSKHHEPDGVVCKLTEGHSGNHRCNEWIWEQNG